MQVPIPAGDIEINLPQWPNSALSSSFMLLTPVITAMITEDDVLVGPGVCTMNDLYMSRAPKSEYVVPKIRKVESIASKWFLRIAFFGLL